MRLEQNWWYFVDSIFKCVFLKGSFCILILISMKFVIIMQKDNMSASGLGSIPFFQFNSNSNSVIFNSNSNSNSTTHNKFQFQFQFQFQRFQFQFQFQFQFRRFQIQPQPQKWPVEVFREIDYNYNSKVYVVVYKIIVINTISLISLVKWFWIHGIMADVIPVA